ncbi:MAG TPA: hypothetical protein VK210_10935 [Terriglobia bacterium]|nr:hypothetical protein [Terriglobia bacterium]
MRSITASLPLLLLPLLVMAIFLGISIYGLDFGYHGDENTAKFDSVRDTLKTGLFIQGFGGEEDGFHYNYGGVNYVLTWIGLTPEIV